MTDALSLLDRSHRRLEEVLASLEAAREAGLEPARDHLETLRDAADYFARAAPRHERDEEESLFVRLPAEAASLTARLTGEHRAQAALHAELAELVDVFGNDADSAREPLCKAIDALRASYRAHIAAEEAELFPIARAHLTPADHEAIAGEMNARRGGGGGGGGRGRGGRGGGGGGGGR